MRIRHKREIAAAMIFISLLIPVVFMLSSFGINSASCAHLCAYRTAYSNGKLSIWLAWANLPLRNATVRVSTGKSYVATTKTNPKGMITIYTIQGFGGGEIAIYYRNYVVLDHVYEYPFVQDLIYIAIGAFAYIAAKRLADHNLSDRKVSISIVGGPAPAASIHKPAFDGEYLQRNVALSAIERPDAIKYSGVVADLWSVCKNAALQIGMNANHAVALSDEIEASIHFMKSELGMSVIGGTIYTEAKASLDICAKHIYEGALYSGAFAVPKVATSQSIIEANLTGICNTSNLHAIAARLMKNGKRPKPIAVYTADKLRVLQMACMPRKSESAFLFMYLSSAIGVVYV